MSRFACWTLLPALLIGGLLATGRAAAAVPQVNDAAKFFSSDAIRKADAEIKEIKNRHKLDLVIDTLPAVPAGDEAEASSKDREVKKSFYEKWARRRAEEAGVNGVYVLITKKPEHLIVEVGNRTGKRAFTVADGEKLQSILLRNFRDKKFDEGLLEGVAYVRKTIDADLAQTSAGRSRSVQIPDVPAVGRGGWTIGGIICVGLVIVAVIWLVSALVRAMTGGGGRYVGGPGGGYGGGGYGGGGYGGGGFGGGGGGFMSSMIGGLFGAAAGNWMYDRFFRGDSSSAGNIGGQNYGSNADSPGQDTDYSSTSGGDFGDNSGQDDGGSGGGDFGGDADTGGGGDFGGGGGGAEEPKPPGLVRVGL